MKELKTISDLSKYKGTDATLFIEDSLQGGLFKVYTGEDEADGGMIFRDADAKKWLRVTTDSKIRLAWYGLKPFNNYGSRDDSAIIKKAIDYIKAHRDQFDILKGGLCQFNEWYYIGTPIVLEGISLEGEGQERAPKTRFQVAPNIEGFIIPAGSPNYTNISNVRIAHYAPTKPERNGHSFSIHTVVNFHNVWVSENYGGNGFHIAATTGAGGNADNSVFTSCQAEHCVIGFFSQGGDANVIKFDNCSAVACQRWGIYEDGLLGNHYTNCHLADNGKEHDTGAWLTIDGVDKAATYFLRADVGTASIGKRPDLHPELWYQAPSAMGRVEKWKEDKQYYAAGPVWAGSANAFNEFRGMYTESFQPNVILGPRTIWYDGLNGASIIGGMWEHMVGGYKFFTGSGIQSPVIATPELRLQGANGKELNLDINFFENIGSGTPTGGVSQSAFNALEAKVNGIVQGLALLTTRLQSKAETSQVTALEAVVAQLQQQVNNLPTTGGNTPNPQLTEILSELQTIINKLNTLAP